MPKQWDQDAVLALKGQEESLRLECKAGALLENKSQDRWLEEVTEAISAFANTEGGTLILGVKQEKRGKGKVVGDPDGISDTLTKDQLRAFIAGNIRPDLPGLEIHRVRFDTLPGRIVFVISVPQGSTAYQAKDRKYYGRVEDESKALLDHEIRLRMARGRIAHASVEFRFRSIKLSAEQESNLRKRNGAVLEEYRSDPIAAFQKHSEEIFDLMLAKTVPDVIELELLLRNDGELTIRDPVVTVVEVKSEKLLRDYHVRTSAPERLELSGHVLYPGDERTIGASLRFECKRGASLVAGDYAIKWKVLLDNSLPSSGDLDLAMQIQSARSPVSESGA